jgi:hypothetical protein
VSNNIDDGGPAFPVTTRKMTEDQWDAYKETHGDETTCVGMTLRDWFAGQALAGILSSMADAGFRDAMLGLADADHIGLEDTLSLAAYEHADAMLKARNA